MILCAVRNVKLQILTHNHLDLIGAQTVKLIVSLGQYAGYVGVEETNIIGIFVGTSCHGL